MAIKEFITKEDAVSYLMGFGEALENFSVQELAAAVAEQADANAHNWVVDNPQKLEKGLLNGMANIADARVDLVHQYQNLIEDMLIQAAVLKVNTKEQGNSILIEYDSFAEWAGDYLYINLPLRKASTLIASKWRDVTIKIKEGYKIQVKIKNHKKTFYMTFSDLGLMARNKYDPNHLGGVLLGMAHLKRYPPLSEALENKHAALISKLNKNIKEMVPITDVSAPIFHDEKKGYLPAFKLVDDSKSRDNRAKNDAVHVGFVSHQIAVSLADFDDEDDEAARFLRENPL